MATHAKAGHSLLGSFIVPVVQVLRQFGIDPLALLEAAFRLVPAVFPDNLRALVETGASSQAARKAVVDFQGAFPPTA